MKATQQTKVIRVLMLELGEEDVRRLYESPRSFTADLRGEVERALGGAPPLDAAAGELLTDPAEGMPRRRGRGKGRRSQAALPSPGFAGDAA